MRRKAVACKSTPIELVALCCMWLYSVVSFSMPFSRSFFGSKSNTLLSFFLSLHFIVFDVAYTIGLMLSASNSDNTNSNIKKIIHKVETKKTAKSAKTNRTKYIHGLCKKSHRTITYIWVVVVYNRPLTIYASILLRSNGLFYVNAISRLNPFRFRFHLVCHRDILLGFFFELMMLLEPLLLHI